jgi:hypothetical protein
VTLHRDELRGMQQLHWRTARAGGLHAQWLRFSGTCTVASGLSGPRARGHVRERFTSGGICLRLDLRHHTIIGAHATPNEAREALKRGRVGCPIGRSEDAQHSVQP